MSNIKQQISALAFTQIFPGSLTFSQYFEAEDDIKKFFFVTEEVFF